MSCRRFARLFAALLALVLVAGACSSDPPQVVVSGDDPTTTAKDLVTTLRDEGYTVYLSLLEEAGLVDELTAGEGDATFTLFAPTDAAFAELSPGLVDLFLGDDDVVAPAPEAGEGTSMASAEEEPTAATPDENTTGDETGGDTATDDTATDDTATDDTATDDTATDDTATDEGAAGAGDDTATDDGEATDEGAAGAGDEAATPVSSGAPAVGERPARSEIDALLADILHNHVVEGTTLAADLPGSLTTLEGSSLDIGSREEPAASEDAEPTTVPTVNGIDIVETDLRATNGVIHTIDSLLVPEDRTEALGELAASIPVTADLITTLERTGEHAQLLAALRSSGLDQELPGLSAVTLFAPTDDAFAALDADQRAALANPEVLSDVLSFHALAISIPTADLSNRRNVRTLEGQSLDIVRTLVRAEMPEADDAEAEGDDAEGDDADAEETTTITTPPPPPEELFTVEGVEIVESFATTNGVVHVIGEVLVPDAAKGPGGF